VTSGLDVVLDFPERDPQLGGPPGPAMKSVTITES